VSHSGDLAAVAASRAGPVGIDVEAVRPLRHALALAGRYFEPAAAARVERATGPERDVTFLQHWTRLEAAAKATGRGIAAILAGASDGPPDAALAVGELGMPPGYVGAVATARPRFAD
jgi:phosphopantetheinyl transferase